MKTPSTLHRYTLHHLYLPSPTLYLHASTLQSHLTRLHLNHKKAFSNPTNPTPAPAPNPTLLTFQTLPTYTCGRREIGTLTPSQIAHLRAGGHADFYEALRGGQTTFHGPGQLTAYLICSLDAHGLTPRSHVRLLEDAVVDTCASAAGIKGFRTENPGVWVSEERKIASVGVHLRRNVSSYGIGLNVSVDLKWFERIVACGLPEKRATSFEREGVEVGGEGEGEKEGYMEMVAGVFAMSVRGRLSNVGEVERITEEELGVGRFPEDEENSSGKS